MSFFKDNTVGRTHILFASPKFKPGIQYKTKSDKGYAIGSWCQLPSPYIKELITDFDIVF